MELARADAAGNDPDWTWEKLNAARKKPPAGTNGTELWRTDGTTAGTALVACSGIASVLIAFLGVAIGGIVIAMYMPMFSLIGQIG